MYGFLVVMGGFVADMSHLHNKLSRLTIYPKGIASLARDGHFINIRDAAIKDKSKANTLAKGFVCTQVILMLAQTVGRRVVGYPITLVEVHTLIHVGCAIALYGLWFQKPLDIRDPVWINASECEDLIALMLVGNYGFGERVHAHDQDHTVPIKSVENRFSNGSEAAYLHVYPTMEKDQPQAAVVPEIQPTSMQSLSSPSYTMQPLAPHWQSAATPTVVTHRDYNSGHDYFLGLSSHGPAICSLTSGQALDCGVGPALSVHSLWGEQEEERHGGRLQISLTSRDIRRWTLAARASRRTGEDLYRDSAQGSVDYFTFYAPNIFLDRKGLQAGFYAYFCGWASGGLVAALTICTFYGASHATAWAFVFPTQVEQLLWRVACIDTIAGVISLLAVFSVAVFLHEHGRKLLANSFFTKEPGIMPLLYRAVVMIEIFNFPIFVASRMYIIVETFISVELGVYQTVQWTDYIPHF